jgi:hypothetical protein
MENRNSRRSSAQRCNRPGFWRFTFAFSICVLLAGCGAPGEPTAPSPPVPTAIGDLSAQQAGDGVQLTFTMPVKTIRGERLTEPPSVEILRGALKPDGSADTKSFHVVYTIPGALVNTYRAEEQHVRFVDPIAPAETRANPGANLVYRIRTRASKKRASPDSNSVTVKVLPVPERIASVHAQVTETAIELTWAAPTRTSGGDPLTATPEYHVYRGALDPHAPAAAMKDIPRDKWISPPALLDKSAITSFRDTQFDFGKTYAYIIRSTTVAGGNLLESDDSDPLVVAAADTFPPAVPQGVAAALISGGSPGSPEVDLSWSIDVEPDLAGYRVYRSEQQDSKGELRTPDLLLSPAYRDTSVQPGHHYWYSVTAVDRTGNESAPSPTVALDVAQPSS